MFRFTPPLALVATAFGVSAALAQDTPTLNVAEMGDFGQYITGPGDKPVYMFTTDTHGNGGDAAISCTSPECLEAWPLVTAEGDVAVGPELDETLIGTVEHDGQSVVTYNGWPLYTFARDQAGQAPQGHDIESFGGEWYLVDPQGQVIEESGT